MNPQILLHYLGVSLSVLCDFKRPGNTGFDAVCLPVAIIQIGSSTIQKYTRKYKKYFNVRNDNGIFMNCNRISVFYNFYKHINLRDFPFNELLEKINGHTFRVVKLSFLYFNQFQFSNY